MCQEGDVALSPWGEGMEVLHLGPCHTLPYIQCFFLSSVGHSSLLLNLKRLKKALNL